MPGKGAVEEPRTAEERRLVASECVKDLKLSIPTLIDDMKNSAEAKYRGWPDRLYIIDAGGRIAYRGDVGPRGFRPTEMEDALRQLLR